MNDYTKPVAIDATITALYDNFDGTVLVEGAIFANEHDELGTFETVIEGDLNGVDYRPHSSQRKGRRK